MSCIKKVENALQGRLRGERKRWKREMSTVREHVNISTVTSICKAI